MPASTSGPASRLRPPALNDLPRWEVEQRDEPGLRGAAARRREAGLAAVAARPSGWSSLAAARRATAPRRRCGARDTPGSITIVDPDRDAPYDRPNLSKDYLAGNAPEEWIPLHPPAFYQEHGIELRRGPKVVGDRCRRAHRVRLDDGTELPYGALLLATGASPVRLDPALEAGPPRGALSAHASRTAGSIVAAAREGGRAVVLGASFIGLEVAASLRARKIDVHVVAPDERPLDARDGPRARRPDPRRARGAGRGLSPGPARPEGRRTATVTLENGERLAADLLVAGIGVRPNLELAEAAGLALDRGVVVNERLETSAPGIFAAGDIARWPDPHTGERIRVEHWVVAERQGQAAARNMLGAREPSTRCRSSGASTTRCRSITWATRSGGTGWRSTVTWPSRTARCGSCGTERVLAVATVGRDLASLEAEVAMERAGGDATLRARSATPARL